LERAAPTEKGHGDAYKDIMKGYFRMLGGVAHTTRNALAPPTRL